MGVMKFRILELHNTTAAVVVSCLSAIRAGWLASRLLPGAARTSIYLCGIFLAVHGPCELCSWKMSNCVNIEPCDIFWQSCSDTDAPRNHGNVLPCVFLFRDGPDFFSLPCHLICQPYPYIHPPPQSKEDPFLSRLAP